MQSVLSIYSVLWHVPQVKAEIERRAAEDVDPEPSEAQQYMRSQISLEGYKHLLAVGALRVLTATLACWV